MRLAPSGDGQRLEAFLLAGDTRAEAWIAPLLQQQLPVEAYGRSLLAAGPLPAGNAPQRDRQVCSCFDVGQQKVVQTLSGLKGSAADRLAGLQQALQCGTQCGSCLPELKRLAELSQGPVPAI
jgi:assimilatory nitrate reductase catalytic subunit